MLVNVCLSFPWKSMWPTWSSWESTQYRMRMLQGSIGEWLTDKDRHGREYIKQHFFSLENGISQTCGSPLYLLVIDSEAIGPSQRGVDQGYGIAAISVALHDDCWAVPVRPEKVAKKQHFIRLMIWYVKLSINQPLFIKC